MRTIAVIGRKGGSGKTTVAVHLAIGLHLRGRTTALVDTDPQWSSVEVFRGRTSPGPSVVPAEAGKLFPVQVNLVRDGVQAIVIDTPAVLEEDTAQAVVIADLALLVVRPSFLDLAAAVRTSDIIRRLRKPGIVVLNQAPSARGAIESQAVVKASEALKLLRLPVAPVVIRGRAAYQSVLESGRSAEELSGDLVAAQEMKAFCDFVDRFAFAPRRSVVAIAQEP
ncbi:MAG TPA: AAA family ATPase [Caulobacteraceae bacterium]|nr:AAA family ATPase [Caulobacteraceae bacterium]